MTLSNLIRALKKFEAEGCGRARVGVNKDTLDDGNGTFNVCDVVKVEAACAAFRA